MAFCKNCGANVPEGSAFCQNCGQNMQETSFGNQNSGFYENGNYSMNSIPNQFDSSTAPAGKGFGIASLVLGIIGILGGFYDFIYALEMKLIPYEELLNVIMGYGNFSDSFGSMDNFVSYMVNFMHVFAIILCVMGLILGVLALLFGIKAISKGYKRGTSVTGTVLGAIICLLTVAGIIITVV